ncbi:hypothetical protein [Micromonospora tarensis]|uniref:Uncharacterized protein n=1 Tax=Micromonospora tarensis TaxID=2806100 RepID=A0ABS1YCT9_9ACTN|nr:hypothetical protein [Micromonospora tarensis]MBM0275215.1 hypothetical protein [Micromonospora tarensis]
MLIAVAIGAGLLLAAFFQSPAAADRAGSGSVDESHLPIGDLIRPVVQLDRHSQLGADGHQHRPPLARPAKATGAARQAISPRVPRRPAAGRPGTAPLPGNDAPVRSGAEREKPRPASDARASQHPARGVDPLRPAAHHTRQPSSVLPAFGHELADWPTVGLIATPLPQVVGVLPIGAVVTALGRLTDPVLPPLPGVVVAPPPLPAAPTPRPGPAPGADPVHRSAPTRPATCPPTSQATPVRSEAVPGAPPLASVRDPVPRSTPTGQHAVREGPVTAETDVPSPPVAPPDQDAAGVNDGSPSGAGLVRPVGRPPRAGVEQPDDLVPLTMRSRTLSVIVRPG